MIAAAIMAYGLWLMDQGLMQTVPLVSLVAFVPFILFVPFVPCNASPTPM